MSLLTMIQHVCGRVGVPRPQTVIGNTDETIIQMLEIANDEGEVLTRRANDPWQAQVLEKLHPTVATENQGLMSVIAPGFKYIINETIYNRTLVRRVGGPIGPRWWQRLKSQQSTGPWEQWRILQDSLFLYPAPEAGSTIAFEYVTSSFCKSSGGTPQTEWLADDDVGILDEFLMRTGIRWRWLEGKGQPYDEVFRTYEMEVMNALGRDKGALTIRDHSERKSPQDTVNVPEGSWPL